MIIDTNKITKSVKENVVQTNTRTDFKVERFLQSRCMQIKHINDLKMQFPTPGELVIIQTENAFSAFDYVLYMINHFKVLDELVLSTFNLGEKVAESFIYQIKNKSILEATIVINNKFRASDNDRKKFDDIQTLSKENYKVKLHFAQNHTKNILVRIKDKYYVWFGSGNSANNSEMEDYIWIESESIFNFKKQFLIR